MTSDSSEAMFTTTDKKGAFLVKTCARAIIACYTFEGYRHIRKEFTIDGTNKDIDLGTLYMQKMSDLLQEVGRATPPVSIHKDTVEYNAGSFTTKPNAVAEDLLKKMPGIQVDKNGTSPPRGKPSPGSWSMASASLTTIPSSLPAICPGYHRKDPGL